MHQQLKKYPDDQAQAIEEDVKQALELCGDDPMRALRAALIANAFLEMENNRLTQQVSIGFTRGQVRTPKSGR